MPTKDELIEKAEEEGVDLEGASTKAEIEARLDEADPEPEPEEDELPGAEPTPSRLAADAAFAAVPAEDDEDLDAVRERGEIYQEERAKHRWG